MTGLKWVFFDLGSTLVDETAVYEQRLACLTEHGKVDRDALLATIRQCEETTATPFRAAAQIHGILELLPPWDNSLERLYPNVQEVLLALSGKYRLGVIANQNPGTPHGPTRSERA